MIPKNKLISLILLLLIVTPTIISAKTLQSKQLAGPPSEFEFMRQAQAEKSAITSKTALIPITLKETKAGNWFWNSTLAVDDQDFSFMIFAGDSKNWIIELINPLTKKVKNIADMDINHTQTKFGIEQNTYKGEKYTFSNMDTGKWNIRVKTIGEPDQFQGFILVTSNSKYQLNSYKTNLDQIVGHTIHFVTQSTSNEKTIEALKDFNPINSAFMLVTKPNGTEQKHPMFDDGLHGDNLANDGLFGGDFKTLAAGDYTVQINAFGNNPNGTPFYRTSQHYVPVIEQALTMKENHVDAISISDNRLNIAIEVDNHAKSSDSRYRVIAEVWARNLSKSEIMKPVSWISTMTTAKNGQLNIELDARWIAMAQVDSGFELRNLRIEDADHFIPLITRSSIDLKITSLPKTANKAYNGAITEEMMMGKRPQIKVNKSGYRGLMLVHGYCSDNVWGPVAGQFAASAVFTDFDQNRSHDQFAFLIGLAGTYFSSYGIVAHSQGGAASLHLYTYYWSGLDLAYGARLIQTVGTPYQGTPLAGTLAAIGNIFGIGCGTNASLTPAGSATWLAGIPTWARSQINYYTTSFNDRPFVFDFCSIGTDLFLSDPDDGVVEKFRGQLSGGNNRGHKSGWCHTNSMRDPGQTTDSSRNAVMNVYAKR